MIAAAALICYALVAAIAGPRVLERRSRNASSPRWAIAGWQALSLSVVGALLLAPLAIAAPLLAPAETSSAALGSTWAAVQHHYANPGGAVVAWFGLACTTVVSARLATSLITTLIRARRRRRAQLDSLTLVGAEQPGGFHLLASTTPTVYCLPGRRPRVVVTSAALDLLDDADLALVLAHERTHLRARHDLVLALSNALAQALPLRVLRVAHLRLTALVEMQADDAADSPDERGRMARALLRLTIAGTGDALSPNGAAVTPASPALGAVGCDAVQRVRRLTGDSSPWRARHSLLAAITTVSVLAMPVGLALGPALGATTIGCCEAREFSVSTQR